MANKKLGYIKLYRSLQNHWLWENDEPFDRRSAWIDLLLMVNHKEDKICIKGSLVPVRPGQRWTSYHQLAEKWHWSVNKVKRYIKLLKSDGMVLSDETNNGTLITIVNWGKFAIKRNADELADELADEYTSDTQTNSQTDTKQECIRMIKNDKELKEEGRPAPSGGGEWQ